MSRRSVWLTVFLACLILSAPAITARRAAASQKPTSNIMVTSTITDYIDVADGSGGLEQVLMQVRSDAAGSYSNTSGVTSIITSTGTDWDLNTTSSTTRHVFLDFSKPIPGSGPGGGAPAA